MMLSYVKVKVKGVKVLPIAVGSIAITEQNKNKTVWEVLTGLPSQKNESATEHIRRRNV